MFWRMKTSCTRAGRKTVSMLLNAPTCIDSGNLTVCYIRLSWQKKKNALSKSLRQTNKSFLANPSNILAMSRLSFLNHMATYALSQSCSNKLVFQEQQFSLHYLPGNLYEVIHPVTTLFFFLILLCSPTPKALLHSLMYSNFLICVYIALLDIKKDIVKLTYCLLCRNKLNCSVYPAITKF